MLPEFSNFLLLILLFLLESIKSIEAGEAVQSVKAINAIKSLKNQCPELHYLENRPYSMIFLKRKVIIEQNIPLAFCKQI
jgi:hypothetical protein